MEADHVTEQPPSPGAKEQEEEEEEEEEDDFDVDQAPGVGGISSSPSSGNLFVMGNKVRINGKDFLGRELGL